MMKYELVGGRPHRLDGAPSALFVYEGPGRSYLLCQMYRGQAKDVSRGAVVRHHGGFDFFIHRARGITMAFWQEGEVTCVLASDMDPEALVQLAFAKAMRRA